MEPDTELLNKRKAQFDEFYKNLIPCLVSFVESMGISPAHEVLKRAPEFAPHLDDALKNMTIESESDYFWLLDRVAFFVGEYFVQKYSGHWFVNEIYGSRFFAKYVVGHFEKLQNDAAMIDPFLVSAVYISAPAPRSLLALLHEAESGLLNVASVSKDWKPDVIFGRE